MEIFAGIMALGAAGFFVWALAVTLTERRGEKGVR